MTTMTEAKATQVYRVFIRATPERIWEAMTKSEFTRKYFYGSTMESTYEVGAPVVSHHEDGSLLRDGEVLECDRRAGWSPRGAAGGGRTSPRSHRAGSPTRSRRPSRASARSL